MQGLNKTVILFASITSAVTFLFWFFAQETLGIALFMIIGAYLIYKVEDTFYPAVLLINAMFMVSFNDWNFASVPKILLFLPLVFLILVIVHVITFKVTFNKGALKPGLALMLVGFLLSGLNRSFDHPFYFFIILMGLFYVGVYLFFVNTLKKHLVDFFVVFSFTGLMIAFQVFSYYLQAEDTLLALSQKGLTAGWGISNIMATFLLFSLPMTAFLLTKVKHNLFFIFSGVLQVIALLLTYSRGGILSFFFLAVPLFVLTVLHVKKRYTALYASCVILLVLGLTQVFHTETSVVLERFLNMDLSSSGRFRLYEEAWQKFLAHPLFGASFFARVDDVTLRLVMYHNTFFQTLAALGLLGIISLGYVLYQQVRLSFSLHYPIKYFVLIALAMTFLHGMVENTYYMVHYTLILFLFIAFIETETT